MDRFRDNLVGYLGVTDQVSEHEVREYVDRDTVSRPERNSCKSLGCIPLDGTCCTGMINPSRWTGSPRSGTRTC